MGATGFIGRNLLESFDKNPNYEVTATHFKRPPIKGNSAKWVNVDLRDYGAVQKIVEGQDVILQYAATTSGSKDIVNKPYVHVTDNAVMNSLIFRAAHESGVKHIVFPSCTVMYQPSETPVKESDLDNNKKLLLNYFGVGNTKLYCEKMCDFYSSLGVTKYTALRQTNIYGPYDKYDLEKSHVFGATITKVLRNTSGELEVWGTGEEKRDFLYVGDLVKLIQNAIEKQEDAFVLVNAGLGKATSINNLVKTVMSVAEKPLNINHNTSKPSIPTSLCVDYSKAEKIFKWKPETKLINGISKTIEWYKKYFI